MPVPVTPAAVAQAASQKPGVAMVVTQKQRVTSVVRRPQVPAVAQAPPGSGESPAESEGARVMSAASRGVFPCRRHAGRLALPRVWAGSPERSAVARVACVGCVVLPRQEAAVAWAPGSATRPARERHDRTGPQRAGRRPAERGPPWRRAARRASRAPLRGWAPQACRDPTGASSACRSLRRGPTTSPPRRRTGGCGGRPLRGPPSAASPLGRRAAALHRVRLDGSTPGPRRHPGRTAG